MHFSWGHFLRRVHCALERRAWVPSATAILLTAIVLGCGCFYAAGKECGLGTLDTWREWGGLSTHGLFEGRWWQPLTSLFLPGNAAWLLTGVPILLLAGRQLEDILGRRHVLAIYGLSGAAAALVQAFLRSLSGEADLPLAGPGAAVLGIFVALACAAPNIELVPPLTRTWTAGGDPDASPFRVKHGALAIVLGAAVIILCASGEFARGNAAASLGPAAASVLAATAVSCFYMRHLGFGRRVGRPLDEEAAYAALAGYDEDEALASVSTAPLAAAWGQLVVPRVAEFERRMTPAQYMRDCIDPILDKITRHGLDSLSDDERRTLRIARDKFEPRR